ncbi:serine protease [Streptomyces sp. cmx-4-9]|uniref:serine protease n=1 Tax=Streptomyces sp. cmx-4-9 TaxID=2790941 RepID=UPI0039801CA4
MATDGAGGACGTCEPDEDTGKTGGVVELLGIADADGLPRGSGFLADHQGTVVTSHAAVAGLPRVRVQAPGPHGRTWLAGAEDVVLLPELALALVRTDGLGVRPLPVAVREPVAPGTYVRIAARGWRQARVLGAVRAARPAQDAGGEPAAVPAVELVMGTDGRDALRTGGEACGGPVLDAATGAVLAVLNTALQTEHRSADLAVTLRAAAAADPAGPLAALLERNAATVPGHGADLNLAGALELTATTLGAAFPPSTRPGHALPAALRTAAGPEVRPGLPPVHPPAGPAADPVERPDLAAALDAFTAGDRPVLGLVGAPGSGRTTALAALAARRAQGARPAPTLWLRGADLLAGDGSVAAAAARALAAASRTVAASGPVPDGVGSPGAWAALDPAGGPWSERAHPAAAGSPRAVPGGDGAARAEGDAEGLAGRVARLGAGAGRALLIVLDAPEEMPPEQARRLRPWTEATTAWLRATGARMVVATRPEHWERAGALYPPGALCTPARAPRRMPPALPVGDLTPAEAEEARKRLGVPAEAVVQADARHPLTLGLLAGIRAAGVTAGRPGREEVFAAHVDLLCLRAAVRIAAAGAGPAGVHGPGVRRLAARVAGRVHEAARRCLGPGQGQLDRDSFEELFPWRTGWAAAVLAEGLLVPAGPGYRFAHEELSDWLQGGRLDVPTALASLVRHPADPVPVPRHRTGPVLEAVQRLPADERHRTLMNLVHHLNALAEAPPDAGPAPGKEAEEDDAGLAGRAWWTARLVRDTLLRASDARPYLPVLHALAEHVNRAGPGEFGGWFWNRLRLPEPDRLDLLRRLLPADPAEAVPGDRYLDAAARRLARDPQRVQPLLCAWFTDGRRLRGRPGATVAAAAQALLHTHRRLAVDDLTEALVAAAHPDADELLAVLAEEEPSALCRAVDRWAHDERPARRVAAAVYGQAAAPHVRTPADRDLLRRAAQALLARPADAALHGSALAVLLRDPQVRGRYLPQALDSFRGTGPGPGPAAGQGCRLPAATLVAVLPVLPDQDAVFAALRERADGEVLRALAALTTPALARRAGDLVREHLGRRPEDAPHGAAFVDRRLEQGPAAEPVLRPLVLDLLRSAPAGVRAELAVVLGAPGGEPSHPLRGELADVLLREEGDPQVLDAFLGAVSAGAGVRAPGRTRDLLQRTGRQLMRVPGGPAVFERRTVELARSDPAFGALVARWMAEAAAEAAALLGPSARRTVETLRTAAADVT